MRNQSISEGKKASVTDMLCTTATAIALENSVGLFICLTSSGKIARFLAKQRPEQTILACSTNSNVVRQVNSSRGVIGYKVPIHLKNHSDKLISLVLKVAKEQEFCYPG